MALTDETCAAPGCVNPSTPNGEHVLPNWLVRAFTQAVWSPGTFLAEHSESGVEHESNQALYSKLPCCEKHNAKLASVFEGPGQAAVKQPRDQVVEELPQRQHAV